MIINFFMNNFLFLFVFSSRFSLSMSLLDNNLFDVVMDLFILEKKKIFLFEYTHVGQSFEQNQNKGLENKEKLGKKCVM